MLRRSVPCTLISRASPTSALRLIDRARVREHDTRVITNVSPY
jgi:hypothetical protein